MRNEAGTRDIPRIGARMPIHDEGNGDRPITAASAVFDVMD